MSDVENSTKNFLQRWSHRKRAAGNTEPPRQADPSEETPVADVEVSQSNTTACNPNVLPPIESLTETSDIRAFLAPGVSLELQRAALRRVWQSDPRIRNFIGIAENQWDFTKPETIPGFGSVLITPELRRVVENLFAEMTREATSPADKMVNRSDCASEHNMDLLPARPLHSFD
jgi:Protein of unknown function (DUF3306)